MKKKSSIKDKFSRDIFIGSKIKLMSSDRVEAENFYISPSKKYMVDSEKEYEVEDLQKTSSGKSYAYINDWWWPNYMLFSVDGLVKDFKKDNIQFHFDTADLFV